MHQLGQQFLVISTILHKYGYLRLHTATDPHIQDIINLWRCQDRREGCSVIVEALQEIFCMCVAIVYCYRLAYYGAKCYTTTGVSLVFNQPRASNGGVDL